VSVIISLIVAAAILRQRKQEKAELDEETKIAALAEGI
jgi:hypothetical protein